MVEFLNYYKLLQVDPLADLRVIEAAFRKLSSIYHPDINKNSEAEEKYKIITEAYFVLKDTEKRKKYNEIYNRFNSKVNKISSKYCDYCGENIPEDAVFCSKCGKHLIIQESNSIISKDAVAWFNKGVAFINLESNGEAIRCFDEVIRINPENADAWYNKGVAFGNLKKYDEAIKCYDEAIRINPEYAVAWFNKGVTFNSLKKYDEAIKCYDKAIRIKPKYAVIWFNKGVAFDSLKKYNEAIKCYDKAIRIKPKYDAWLNKGNAIYKLGKYKEAIKCYDMAIRINPENANARKNRDIALSHLKSK